jgi:hypothetical protein
MTKPVYSDDDNTIKTSGTIDWANLRGLDTDTYDINVTATLTTGDGS